MTHPQLTTTKRVLVGNQAKKLYRSGLVPAVLFSKAFPSTNIEVNLLEFIKIFKQTKYTGVIDLILDKKTIPVLVHSLNVHPSKRTLRHIDFLVVNLKEKVSAEVPITVVGIAPGVKSHGGIVNIVNSTIAIVALPDAIPEKIEIDISSLTDLDSGIYLNDIKLPKNTEAEEDDNILLVNLVTESVEAPETVTEEVVTEETK
jgi:large subunit ribosomal protein L25